MHFQHPRTITTFENRNFVKICVFQGFPYTRLGHFGSKKIQNPCRKWPRIGEKLKKKLEIFQKIFETSPECVLGTSEVRTIITFKSRNFLKILVFEGSSIHQIRPFWVHFGPKNFEILAENGQGVVKD